MESAQRTDPSNIANSPSSQFKAALSDSLRFWERGRVVYNLILMAVVATWIFASWPHFRPTMNMFSLLRLMILGFIANVLYCAAYVVDVPMQSSDIRSTWRRWRWTLWAVGTLFAFLLTNYWIADEIYPFVN
jgi:hypothetical protein